MLSSVWSDHVEDGNCENTHSLTTAVLTPFAFYVVSLVFAIAPTPEAVFIQLYFCGNQKKKNPKPVYTELKCKIVQNIKMVTLLKKCS